MSARRDKFIVIIKNMDYYISHYQMSARILIVDDNVSLTTLLAKSLARFGYEPFVENDSMMAFGTVQKLMPDIILLDVMMPGKDGGKVLAELTSELSTCKIPVILLTALAREARGLAALFGLEGPVIGKPVELKVLHEEIERRLAKGRSYNERISHDTDCLQEEQLCQSSETSEASGHRDLREIQEVEAMVTPLSESPREPHFLAEDVKPLPHSHHVHPDFKALFSGLPPLQPRPGFGPYVPADPRETPDS